MVYWKSFIVILSILDSKMLHLQSIYTRQDWNNAKIRWFFIFYFMVTCD